jgi:hypothetical protein
MKKLLFIIFGVFFATSAYCQDTQQLIGQMAEVYTGSDLSSSGLIGGFSMWGLMGGILFGSIGFGVFIYGKKNSELKPTLIGIALMIYPYFLRGTIALYLVGIGLTAALYFFRD